MFTFFRSFFLVFFARKCYVLNSRCSAATARNAIVGKLVRVLITKLNLIGSCSYSSMYFIMFMKQPISFIKNSRHAHFLGATQEDVL